MTTLLDRVTYFPVPVRFVPDVTRLLADLMAEPSSDTATIVPVPTSSVPSSLVSQPDVPDWTEEDLRRLLPLLTPQNKVALAVLDLAAASPGNLVSFPDACQKAGLGTSQGRAGIGAMTKVCLKIGKKQWPVSYHWAEGGENIAYYKMSQTTAERWLRVRS